MNLLCRGMFAVSWVRSRGSIISGLFIHGCSFENLHPDSDLSDESKDLLRMYGAKGLIINYKLKMIND